MHYNPYPPLQPPSQSGAGPSHSNTTDPRRNRSSTSPVTYYPNVPPPSPPVPPPLPRALMPGFAPTTTHRSDLFFVSPPGPQTNMRPSTAHPSVPPRPPVPRHTQQQYQQPFHHRLAADLAATGYHPPPAPPSQPAPSLHRAFTAPAPLPPPIPPKPSHHSTLPPSLPPKLPVHPPAPVPPLPLSQSRGPPPVPNNQRPRTPATTSSAQGSSESSEGDELALVLALSQSESVKQQQLADKFSNQENEDLKRALEESMRLVSPPSNSSSSTQSFNDKEPHKDNLTRARTYTPGYPSNPAMAAFALRELQDHNSDPSAMTQISDDEAFARRLAAEDQQSAEKKLSVSDSKLADTPKDEEYARRLMAEVEKPISKSPRVARAELDQTSASTSNSPSLPVYQVSYTQPSDEKRRQSPHVNRRDYIAEDEALARRLAAEDEAENKTSTTPRSNISKDSPPSVRSYTKLPGHVAADATSGDEKLARRLAAEEQLTMKPEEPGTTMGMPVSIPASTSTSPSSNSTSIIQLAMPALDLPSPPSYADAILPSSKHSTPPLSRTSSHTSIVAPTTKSGHEPTSSAGSPSVDQKPLSPKANSAAYLSDSNAQVPLPSTTEPSAEGNGAGLIRPATSPDSISATGGKMKTSNLPLPIDANQFVDADLFLGVSVGFAPPVITSRLQRMPGQMANIISLPYGQCPPLHLQAPNWKHLLKLMARLAGTRLEPTVEAMALTKTTCRLRTVINFVKPHHTSPDWRVILWFTIDHPVPASAPNSHKYINGDVTTLPWTYTLSNIPTLLRDGADSPMSKYYVVPASDAIPYPTLPISFPDLAMYLQVVLEESRRHTNDSSSGKRKLAKTIDMCYPNVRQEDDTESSERSTVGGLFKRFMGRNQNGRRGGGGNEDTYEFVTPFVADEWG